MPAEDREKCIIQGKKNLYKCRLWWENPRRFLSTPGCANKAPASSGRVMRSRVLTGGDWGGGCEKQRVGDREPCTITGHNLTSISSTERTRTTDG